MLHIFLRNYMSVSYIPYCITATLWYWKSCVTSDLTSAGNANCVGYAYVVIAIAVVAVGDGVVYCSPYHSPTSLDALVVSTVSHLAR